MIIVLLIMLMIIVVRGFYYWDSLAYVKRVMKTHKESYIDESKREKNFEWLKEQTTQIRKLIKEANIKEPEIKLNILNGNINVIDKFGDFKWVEANNMTSNMLIELSGYYKHRMREMSEIKFWIDFPKKIFNYIFGENFLKFGNAINAVAWIAIFVLTIKNTNINNMDSVVGALKEIIKIGK